MSDEVTSAAQILLGMAHQGFSEAAVAPTAAPTAPLAPEQPLSEAASVSAASSSPTPALSEAAAASSAYARPTDAEVKKAKAQLHTDTKRSAWRVAPSNAKEKESDEDIREQLGALKRVLALDQPGADGPPPAVDFTTFLCRLDRVAPGQFEAAGLAAWAYAEGAARGDAVARAAAFGAVSALCRGHDKYMARQIPLAVVRTAADPEKSLGDAILAGRKAGLPRVVGAPVAIDDAAVAAPTDGELAASAPTASAPAAPAPAAPAPAASSPAASSPAPSTPEARKGVYAPARSPSPGFYAARPELRNPFASARKTNRVTKATSKAREAAAGKSGKRARRG